MTRHPILFTFVGYIAAAFAAAMIVPTVQGRHPLSAVAEVFGMLSKAAALGVAWSS
jgi:hypothetical protein